MGFSIHFGTNHPLEYLLTHGAESPGVQHGYKRAFDGFSRFFNWLPERCTGALLWDFLFILGRSIDWYTSVRMVMNHHIYIYIYIYIYLLFCFCFKFNETDTSLY